MILVQTPLGYETNGNRNWIRIGGLLTIQPSEFAKLALVLWAAALFHNKRRRLKEPAQLLLPFILGHLSRPLTAAWVAKNRRLIRITDQSSILLVVYTAFSEAVLEGIWSRVSLGTLVIIGVVSLALLAVVLAFTTYSARALGFNKADEITIVFCGSKKSLANGIPMANILFPPASVGILVLPLMLFHQIQLMLCAVLAQRYAKRPQED